MGICYIELFLICRELLFRIVKAVDESLFHGDGEVEVFLPGVVQVSFMGSFQRSQFRMVLSLHRHNNPSATSSSHIARM